MSESTRHPRINYWFWTDKTLKNKEYLKTLDRIAGESSFDVLTLTDRGCDFWDPIHKETFSELVTHAHEKIKTKSTLFAQLLVRKLRSFIRLWRVVLLRSDIRYASFRRIKYH